MIFLDDITDAVNMKTIGTRMKMANTIKKNQMRMSKINDCLTLPPQ